MVEIYQKRYTDIVLELVEVVKNLEERLEKLEAIIARKEDDLK